MFRFKWFRVVAIFTMLLIPWSCVSATSASAQGDVIETAQAATISGVVCLDKNRDGQCGLGENGVSGAAVMLEDGHGALMLTKSTEEGFFTFQDVVRGSYNLTVQIGGWKTTRQFEVAGGVGEYFYEVPSPGHQAFLPLALKATDACTGSVDVHVYDEVGNPTGAVMFVKRMDGVNWGTSVISPEGHHVFHLVCGEYRLLATNHTLGLEGWIGLKIDGRAIVRMVFMYPTTSAAETTCLSPISGRTFWDRNANSALDAGEEISATVALYTLNGSMVAETESGSGGAFDLGSRPCGVYRLQAQNGVLHLRGGRVITTTEILEFWDVSMSRETSVSITGTVFDDTNNNSLLDAGESGVSGLVSVYKYAGGHLETVWTSSSGEFSVTLSGLDVQFPPDEYRLFFSRWTPRMYIGPIRVDTIPFGEARTVNIPVHVPRLVFLPHIVR